MLPTFLPRPHRFAGLLQRVVSLLVVSSILLGLAFPVIAQDEGRVQIIEGRAGTGHPARVIIPDLKPLQRLSVYVRTTSGNLDPMIALADASLDSKELINKFDSEVSDAIAAGEDPLQVTPQVSDEFFLAWDDDSGAGHDAAFEYVIPLEGDYQLLLFSSPFNETSGSYELVIGLDAPIGAAGDAEPSGQEFAFLQRGDDLSDPSAEEVGGELGERGKAEFYVLNNLKSGDTVYAFVEATSGDLKPILLLEDFSGKTIASGNFGGLLPHATLQYTVNEDVQNYRIRLMAGTEAGALTTGAYRMQVGVNEPDALIGQAFVSSRPALQKPTDVKVGVQMDQITGVDQQAENFGVAATLRMEWYDPRLAFDPDECDCSFKTFHGGAFDSYLSATGLTWPEFILFNQQGRRDTQSRVVVVESTGDVIYFERFSVTLQAPDFDFRLFPFDRQKFFIRVQSVFPESFYTFSELPEFTGLGEQLGEEEWVIQDTWTELETVDGNDQYSFAFDAKRHLIFYIVRILVPILVIIIVSWFTFFLKDYGKRVDVASANLLLFIAFNFTISGELPRLGYLTFLDTVLVSTFVVTALVVIFNVWLKRLEVSQKESVAQTIDKFSIWLYPLLYIGAMIAVTFLFNR